MHVISGIGIHSENQIYLDTILKGVNIDELNNQQFKSTLKNTNKLFFDCKFTFNIKYPELT